MVGRGRGRGRRLAASVALVAALGLTASGCGGDDGAEVSDAPGTATTAAAGAASATKENKMSKPTVSVPTGAVPTTLVAEDLVVGTGVEATKGKTVTVQYVGVHLDGSQFDASWDRSEPFSFRLGGGQVIAGWDQGVAGMKVGGRRQLVIPADLAYGPRGFPPVIQPNETLVFVVDLLDVK